MKEMKRRLQKLEEDFKWERGRKYGWDVIWTESGMKFVELTGPRVRG